MSVAKRVRKVEGGFDVCEGSAAGEHVVMYLLKFRPLCLIHNICSPFPLSTPLLCTLTCTCTMRCGAINSLTPSASISFKVCASLFESLSLARVLSASRAPNAVRPPSPPPASSPPLMFIECVGVVLFAAHLELQKLRHKKLE